MVFHGDCEGSWCDPHMEVSGMEDPKPYRWVDEILHQKDVWKHTNNATNADNWESLPSMSWWFGFRKHPQQLSIPEDFGQFGWKIVNHKWWDRSSIHHWWFGIHHPNLPYVPWFIQLLMLDTPIDGTINGFQYQVTMWRFPEIGYKSSIWDGDFSIANHHLF